MLKSLKTVAKHTTQKNLCNCKKFIKYPNLFLIFFSSFLSRSETSVGHSTTVRASRVGTVFSFSPGQCYICTSTLQSRFRDRSEKYSVNLIVHRLNFDLGLNMAIAKVTLKILL